MATAKHQCLNCQNRYPGCHDKCESYQEYRKNREEELLAKQKYLQSIQPFMEKSCKAAKIRWNKKRK